jgi:hypothetical protein
MEHNQAVSYLNEIRDACATLSPEDLQQIEIKTNIQYAVGYTILIRSFLNSVCKRQITFIAEKYRLAMEEDHEGLMIFQPKTALNALP